MTKKYDTGYKIQDTKGLLVRAFGLFTLLASFIMASGFSVQAQNRTAADTKVTLQPLSHLFTLYGQAEFSLTTDRQVKNPFDLAQADLWVQFSSPTGKLSRVPAFWYQDFDQNTIQKIGKPHWRVRFSPNEAGNWKAEVVSGPQPTSALIFKVLPSSSPGFVRISSQNKRYFAFDNGDLYIPIGLNIGWSTRRGRAVLNDYERWFDQLSANGGNVARIWMADWSFGLEWSDTPLGNYSNRLDRAWLLDQVFKMAEERGIYIMLTLLHHGPFNTSVNPQWEQNPYNVKLGGMLKSPAEFVTNAQAKELFKRRLRYIAARWGYSTSLFAWEWWNEVNWTLIDDKLLIPWSAEMAEELAKYDPYNHLLTSSYANGRGHQLWASPEIDFAQHHDYTGADPLKEFDYAYQAINKIAPEKPILMGEQGLNTGGADTQAIEAEKIHFHNGIWAAPFLGYAGSSMYWWWDTFVDPLSQWHHYKSLSEFIKGIDLRHMESAKASSKGIKALLLKSDATTLVWLRSNAYDASSVAELYNADVLKALKEKRTLTNWKYEPPLFSTSTILLKGLTDGDYTLHWYDPQTSIWLAEQEITIENGEVMLSIPPFNMDIAVKISR